MEKAPFCESEKPGKPKAANCESLWCTNCKKARCTREWCWKPHGKPLSRERGRKGEQPRNKGQRIPR